MEEVALILILTVVERACGGAACLAEKAGLT